MHTIGLPRTCLGFTNIFFLLIGFITCAVCVWCIINTDFFRDVNYTVTKSSLVSVIANFVNLKLWFTPMTTILIPIGILISLTSCCGILGAGCKMKCAIKSYIFLVSVITSTAFWLFFITGIYNIYTNNEKTRAFMRSTIITNYGKDNDLITEVWNHIMINYECCGVVDYTDFKGSKWQVTNKDKLYPIQCCKFVSKTNLVPISKDCSISNDLTIHSNKNNGCFNALRKSISENKGRLIFYIILLGLSYTILIYFSYCIIRGEPLLGAMAGNLTSYLPKRKEPESKVIPSNTSLDNMLFVEEPPKKIVRVVSAINPKQSYKFTPNGYVGDNTYHHNVKSYLK